MAQSLRKQRAIENEAAVAKLLEQVKMLRGENEALRSANDRLTQENLQVASKVAGLQGQVKDREATVQAKNEEISRLNDLANKKDKKSKK